MALYPEVDAAIDEIVNEAICAGEDNDIVKIILDSIEEMPSNLKDAIEKEFNEILKMLKFDKEGHNIFRKWYVDGRLYFHVVANKNNPEEGISELVYIDPRKIKKVKEVITKNIKPQGQPNETATSTKVINEYYLYNEKGFNAGTAATSSYTPTSGIRIAVDSIIHVTSGATDPTGTNVLSYLHKAAKTLAQLRTLEDATVIYQLVRAPERRLWKVDVGNLPRMKADQYVKDLMTRHKNKLVYDVGTGEVRDNRKFLTMLEDYWLPVRDGKGTEVDTLPSGEFQGVTDNVIYFQKKLYNSLNVPVTRLNSEDIFSSGKATEITRAEIKFSKFIYKIRTRFCDLFLSILERQLILKNIMTYDDWKFIKDEIKFDFARDSYWAELKDIDILTDRANVLGLIAPFVGRYYSNQWIRKYILKQTDKDIENIDNEIGDESSDPQYAPQILEPEIDMDEKPNEGPVNEPMPKPEPPNKEPNKKSKVTK